MANIEQAEQTKKNTDISVDSLKIRIPIHLVEIQDSSLTSKWIYINEDTGEVDPDNFKRNALTRYFDKSETVRVRFGLEKQRTEFKTIEEYLTILLPSKVLGNRYFEGITIGNISLIYEGLMSMGIVRFSKNDFLHESACTDIDFKQDFETLEFDKLITSLSSSVTASKQRGEGIRLFKQSDNKGIEFNERKTSRYKTKPFLKLYHKGIEITTLKNKDFYNAYLRGYTIDNLCRVEATIKNKAHLRHLKIEGNSLHDILTLSDEQKRLIISKAVQCNLEPRVQPIRKPKNMSLDKVAIYIQMQMLIQQGFTFEIIKGQILSAMPDKTSRHRKGKELDEIYMQNIKGEKSDLDAEELNRIYDLIGWR